jgi:hypothetical protein
MASAMAADGRESEEVGERREEKDDGEGEDEGFSSEIKEGQGKVRITVGGEACSPLCITNMCSFPVNQSTEKNGINERGL